MSTTTYNALESTVWVSPSMSDRYYPSAVDIRIACFFPDLNNVDSLIADEFEQNGLHLVYLSPSAQVLGTGRLNLIDNSCGLISQMAVHPDNQRQGIGSAILVGLIKKSKDKNLTRIILSARLSALKFYEKHGFEPISTPFPSQKTGVLHQKMERQL